MDTYILDQSPLATYLEGKGEADSSFEEGDEEEGEEDPQHTDEPRTHDRCMNDADLQPPPSTPTSSSRLPLLTTTPVVRVRNAYAYAVASTLGKADNDRFLEHFRYILIASQLLNDHVAPGTFRHNLQQAPAPTEYGPATISILGAGISAAVAFALVWVLHWARGEGWSFHRNRLFLLVGSFILAGLLFYGYIRRQWLQLLRHQALTTSADFVTSAQSFEATSIATLTMIQEVELVSRGYKISTPLPPISRLETSTSARRCSRLRKNLQYAYSTVIPAFADAARTLRPYANADDLERFLDVYDIRVDDLEHALSGSPRSDRDDVETLRQLRVHQNRLSTVRRLVLCTLLAIPASGRKEDAMRWRMSVGAMETLRAVLADAGGRTSKLLQDEENSFSILSPGQQSVPPSPRTHARFQSQARRISQLSSGIRSIQARLYLFRDDSTRALSTSTSEPELTTLSSSLRDQYEAIGSDLRSLMHAWETGRQTLVDDIGRQERRVSRVSSGLCSSTPSIGGLTAVEEDDDADSKGSLSPRSSAFRKLVGDRPLSPPVTESEDEGSKDDEVFEAVALPLPRERNTLPREERIKKMHEAREQQIAMREKRNANMSMIRELQTVIHLRPSKNQRRNTVMGPSE